MSASADVLGRSEETNQKIAEISGQGNRNDSGLSSKEARSQLSGGRIHAVKCFALRS
jgi:hypothetical protein